MMELWATLCNVTQLVRRLATGVMAMQLQMPTRLLAAATALMPPPRRCPVCIVHHRCAMGLKGLPGLPSSERQIAYSIIVLPRACHYLHQRVRAKQHSVATGCVTVVLYYCVINFFAHRLLRSILLRPGTGGGGGGRRRWVAEGQVGGRQRGRQGREKAVGW